MERARSERTEYMHRIGRCAVGAVCGMFAFGAAVAVSDAVLSIFNQPELIAPIPAAVLAVVVGIISGRQRANSGPPNSGE
jgi:hypothetical protein